eukprot:1250767-Pyramimonas_sp.AAC.1
MEALWGTAIAGSSALRALGEISLAMEWDVATLFLDLQEEVLRRDMLVLRGAGLHAAPRTLKRGNVVSRDL